MPAFLNYHHLRYFRTIAHERRLVNAAAKLNLSASALSIQLRQLEESLGHTLFERTRRGLHLTEAGRLALDYADLIGHTGEELLDAMKHRPKRGRQVLRVGSMATLSRNFHLEFVRPILKRPDVELIVRSASWRELLVMLGAHEVDVVLSNQPARRDAQTRWHSHLLAEEPVGLVGSPEWKKRRLRFPKDYDDCPVILPGLESEMRAGFDRMVAGAGVRPRIVAESDDMAMLRLLARQSAGLALVPLVVVRGEIESGELVEVQRLAGIKEPFYAVTPHRRFPNPLVSELVARWA
jgi:LysR family transcriptional activator of nhaA